MAAATVCSTGANGLVTLMTGSVAQLAAMAAIAGALIMAATYILGRVIENQKLMVWSKTEIFQLVASVATITFLAAIISTFCSLQSSDLAALTAVTTTPPSGSIFDGAKSYLTSATMLAHQSVNINRYYLEAFSAMEMRSLWSCDLWCIFGGSGHSESPDAGYSSFQPALNLAMNTSFFAFFSGMNYLFILEFMYSGLPLFFLPMGLFLRSMPYLRQLGSLLIALVFSFLLVYPAVLALLGLVTELTDAKMSGFTCPTSGSGDCSVVVKGKTITFDENSATSLGAGAVAFDLGTIADEFFESDYVPLAPPLTIAGQAFFAAVFMPTVAMLAAIASTMYLARFMGQEIDLSRVVQMV